MNKQMAHLDQLAKAKQKQLVADITGKAVQGLLASHPQGQEINIDELAKDAVAIARATVRELLMNRCI